MIIYLPIFVLGVDYVKNSVYSGLNFSVDQNKLFKDELKIICDSFNAICSSDIGIILQKDILKYCVKCTNIEVTALGNEFDSKFHELSKNLELEPSCIFLNQILEVKLTNISDIFAKVKRLVHWYVSKLIDGCKEVIHAYYNNNDTTLYENVILCEKLVSSISELAIQIDVFSLASKEGTSSGKDLIERIIRFLKEFYEYYDLTGIIPTMDAYIYNNYMLFLTILRLHDAVNEYNRDCVYKDSYWYGNNRVINIKNLINNLSVETFMFLTQNNEDFIHQMKYNVTASNIKFWNAFKISKILKLRSILDINYNNLIQELKRYIIDNMKYLSQEDLKSYKAKLEGFKTNTSTIIENWDSYRNKKINILIFSK